MLLEPVPDVPVEPDVDPLVEDPDERWCRVRWVVEGVVVLLLSAPL